MGFNDRSPELFFQNFTFLAIFIYLLNNKFEFVKVFTFFFLYLVFLTSKKYYNISNEERQYLEECQITKTSSYCKCSYRKRYELCIEDFFEIDNEWIEYKNAMCSNLGQPQITKNRLLNSYNSKMNCDFDDPNGVFNLSSGTAEECKAVFDKITKTIEDFNIDKDCITESEYLYKRDPLWIPTWLFIVGFIVSFLLIVFNRRLK